MPIAEIIAIGTELLLGEIQDTNTRFLARTLRDYGIDIYRATIIGDNPERVAQAVCDACSRAQIIITSGGLGPTVDDPTREAIATAIHASLEYHPELWGQIVKQSKRFNRKVPKNNKRQAYIPKGATAVKNPVGSAPAFIVEYGNSVIICLPGVPREMEFLMINSILPYLQQKFPSLGIIKARVLHTVGMGESRVDEIIGDLERSNNPTVGLLAHPGQVDVRITAKAETEDQANDMILEMETKIREMLGDIIFGSDEETLENIIQRKLKEQNITITILECGTNGSIVQRFNNVNLSRIKSFQILKSFSTLELKQEIQKLIQSNQTNYYLGVSLNASDDPSKMDLFIVLIMNQSIKEGNFSFGGHPSIALNWAATIALDFLRRRLSMLD